MRSGRGWRPRFIRRSHKKSPRPLSGAGLLGARAKPGVGSIRERREDIGIHQLAEPAIPARLEEMEDRLDGLDRGGEAPMSDVDGGPAFMPLNLIELNDARGRFAVRDITRDGIAAERVEPERVSANGL